MASILIVSTPKGQAPLWVREAWVGLSLPTWDYKGSRPYLGSSVLSGPKGVLGSMLSLLLGKTIGVEGYHVRSVDAVRLLELAHPKAAEWWRTNTPHLLKGGQAFVFDEAACRLETQT